MISYLPTVLIPGDKIVHDLYGREVISLNDRDLYGRTTEDDRREIDNVLNRARQSGDDKERAALNEASTEARIANAYGWGILDTCKHLFSTAQFEMMMSAIWNFSCEVQYASFMFHAERAVGKNGYATAWQTFLRYNPQVNTLLEYVQVSARDTF